MTKYWLTAFSSLPRRGVVTRAVRLAMTIVIGLLCDVKQQNKQTGTKIPVITKIAAGKKIPASTKIAAGT